MDTPHREHREILSATSCPRCGARRGSEPADAAGALAAAPAAAAARLGWLLQHASDIVSVIDADGTIRYESPSVERLLGWQPEALVGTCIFDYVHPDDLAHVIEAVKRRITDPAPVNPPTEFRVRAGDGTWHVLAAMSRVTRDETGAVSLVVNSRDITEQRALEERLRQAQRIESIWRLAGGIAHDFNNLLTVIIGRSELLSVRLAPDDPMRHSVEIIQTAASQGAALTQQLLAFGRKQLLSLATLDLNGVVLGIGPVLERLVGDRVSLLTSLAPDLRPIRGDRASIEQALLTLVSHARDATPRGTSPSRPRPPRARPPSPRPPPPRPGSGPSCSSRTSRRSSRSRSRSSWRRGTRCWPRPGRARRSSSPPAMTAPCTCSSPTSPCPT